MKEDEKSDLEEVNPEESEEKEESEEDREEEADKADKTDKENEGHSIMEEIREENDILDELGEKIHQHKKKYIRKVGIITTAVVLTLVAGIVYVVNQTYTNTRILSSYTDDVRAGEQYVEYADGFLKYTRDGAAFMTEKGKEKWNASYQMQSPIISVEKNSVAIADKGGNMISVFGKKGLKGEIHTNLPIEKVVVSSQGIVSVILKDGNTSRVVCYDAAGNLLVEHKTSPTTTGYPMDIDLSEDGKTLLVSYLKVNDGVLKSRVVFYNFGVAGKEDKDYVVAEASFDDAIVPTVFYMNQQTSVVVADHEIVIFRGTEAPEKVATINIPNEMKSVFYDERYIGVVTYEEGKNSIQLYNRKGNRIMSQQFEGEYKNAKISDDAVILYSGKQCAIFSKGGVQRFSGEFPENILEIKSLWGINKYLVINGNGFEEIRLTK